LYGFYRSSYKDENGIKMYVLLHLINTWYLSQSRYDLNWSVVDFYYWLVHILGHFSMAFNLKSHRFGSKLCFCHQWNHAI
jgi:hypothetical protein